jgi:hypothetical protein
MSLLAFSLLSLLLLDALSLAADSPGRGLAGRVNRGIGAIQPSNDIDVNKNVIDVIQ